MPGAVWFPGGEAELRRSTCCVTARPSARPSCSSPRPANARPSPSAELRAQAAAVAGRLRGLGVGPGDRVVGYLPNCLEGVVAFTAVALIGAVWAQAGLDYASAAAADRLGQLAPKVLDRRVRVPVRRACPRPPGRGERAARRCSPASRTPSRWPPAASPSPAPDAGSSTLGRGPGGRPRRPGRAGALRPPAVGALHVRHDRQAQGDRARARWGAPGAAGVARPAHGPARGRRLLLVHDAELDDVERPGLRAAARRDDRALRRAPDVARCRTRSGASWPTSA